MWRVRGIQCVLVPKVADELELTSTQRQQIQDAVQRTASQLDELRKQVQSGESQSRAEQLALTVAKTDSGTCLANLQPNKNRAW